MTDAPSRARVGLVLEGGGMRAAYTSGVLDAFLDNDVDIPYVIGVSAGANAGSDYVAGQRERNHKVFVELVSDRRYAGFRNLLRERGWFGMDLLFRTLPDELAPFDYEAFGRSHRTMVVAVTDCSSGEAAYFKQCEHDPRWFIDTVQRASSSLPMLSPSVKIYGRRYLDGGVADPIPLQHSVGEGNRRNVVVLTRNAGYRKAAPRLDVASRLVLPRHPELRRAMAERHLRYNETLDQLDALERTGEAFVLRPVLPLVVGRMERDVARLETLYRQGYDETVDRMPALNGWLAAGLTPTI